MKLNFTEKFLTLVKGEKIVAEEKHLVKTYNGHMRKIAAILITGCTETKGAIFKLYITYSIKILLWHCWTHVWLNKSKQWNQMTHKVCSLKLSSEFFFNIFNYLQGSANGPLLLNIFTCDLLQFFRDLMLVTMKIITLLNRRIKIVIKYYMIEYFI